MRGGAGVCTSGSVSLINEGSDRVRKSFELAQAAGTALGQIVALSNHVGSLVQSIDAAAEELAAASGTLEWRNAAPDARQPIQRLRPAGKTCVEWTLQRKRLPSRQVRSWCLTVVVGMIGWKQGHGLRQTAHWQQMPPHGNVSPLASCERPCLQAW